MFSHTFNGLTYADTSSSSASSSSSPNSFPHSPLRPGSANHPSHSRLHQITDVPSTFLPSYYPEGRYAEHRGTSFEEGLSRSHSPATWEKLSQAGPSTRHLLEGTNLIEPHPRSRTTKRELGPPEYRISPGSIASSFVNKTTASFPMDPSLQGGSHSSTPNSLGTDSPGGGGGGGASTGRYHPYSQQSTRDRDGGHQHSNSGAMSSTSGSMSRHNTYNNTTMPEPTPSSTAYPGNMYGNVPLPERPELDPWERMEGDITGEDYAHALEIYSHMLEAVPSMRPTHDPPPPGGQRYDHLLNLASDGLSFLTGPTAAQAQGQGQATNFGQLSHPTDHTQQSSAATTNKRPAPYPTNGSMGLGSSGNGDKKVTKCLGCGATETPEWRRGPMGPRTLCNACGLVHMKLQRKKKKQEEKAAAAAAAAGQGR